MTNLQNKVFTGSIAAVNKMSAVKLLVNTLIYGVIAGILIYVIDSEGFDWMDVLIVAGFGFIYSFFQDFFRIRAAKKMLASHHAFVLAKHPKTELYVPMLDKLGNTILLKRAGLFVENGKLAMEAFNQPAFTSRPKDSITIGYGSDFRITDAFDDVKKPITVFKAVLMNNPYQFAIWKDEETVAAIRAFWLADRKDE
ncbi:MAG: hypothetical protein V1761_01965 [bacterium]